MGQTLPHTIVREQALHLVSKNHPTIKNAKDVNNCLQFSTLFHQLSFDISNSDTILSNLTLNQLSYDPLIQYAQQQEIRIKGESMIIAKLDRTDQLIAQSISQQRKAPPLPPTPKQAPNESLVPTLPKPPPSRPPPDPHPQDSDGGRISHERHELLNGSFGSGVIKKPRYVDEENFTDNDSSSVDISRDFAKLKEKTQNTETSYQINERFWPTSNDPASAIPVIPSVITPPPEAFERIVFHKNIARSPQAVANKPSIQTKPAYSPTAKILNFGATPEALRNRESIRDKLIKQRESLSQQLAMQENLKAMQSQKTETMREKFDRLLRENQNQASKKQKYFNNIIVSSARDTDTEKELLKAIGGPKPKTSNQSHKYNDGTSYAKKKQQQQAIQVNLQQQKKPKPGQHAAPSKNEHNISPHSSAQPMQAQSPVAQQPQSPNKFGNLKQARYQMHQTKPHRMDGGAMKSLQDKLFQLTEELKCTKAKNEQDVFGEKLLKEVKTEVNNLAQTIKDHISPSKRGLIDLSALPDFVERPSGSIDLERLSSYQESLS